jgi:hypothetical protein
VGQPTEFFIGADIVGIHFGESRLFDFRAKLLVQRRFFFDARNIISNIISNIVSNIVVWIVVDARSIIALL